MQPIRIQNDALSIEVWPQIGGKVSSLIDKADGYELLFTLPVELPDAPNYDVPYGDHWYCGWDECFPGVAPGPYPGHPYKGISIPDHGELWGIPVTTAVPTRDGITTVWHGLRFGYRLTRKLYLDGPAIVGEYSLVNLAPFEFRFVWAMHALLSVVSPMQLDAGAVGSCRLSHDADGNTIDTAFDWPTGPDGEQFSRPESLPPKKGWKLFSSDPVQQEIVIQYPARNRTLTVQYTSEDALPAYWGIWMNSGGWAGHKHIAIEPTTGRYDQLDRAVKDGSAGRAAAFGRVNWAVRWSVA